MSKTNPFVHLTWPFALMAVFAVLGHVTVTIAMAAIFVAGAQVICTNRLIGELKTK